MPASRQVGLVVLGFIGDAALLVLIENMPLGRFAGSSTQKTAATRCCEARSTGIPALGARTHRYPGPWQDVRLRHRPFDRQAELQIARAMTACALAFSES